MKNVNTKLVFICVTLLFSNLLFSQIVSSNGWYFPKTPMSNVFGYPFIDVEDKNKEAVVSSGSVLQIDSANDLSVNTGFNYFKIFEESWRQILLGSLYRRNKNIQLTVESWRAKRWVFTRNKFREFDKDTYYPVEAISADSIRITCKVLKSSSGDSKIIEKILKDYLKGNTVAFQLLDAFSNNSLDTSTTEKSDSTAKSKSDTLKGLLQFLKKDSSEFVIDINKENVLYALKFGKLEEIGKTYFKVQDSYEKDIKIPLGSTIRKTLLNYPYQPNKSSGIVNVYVDLVRKNLSDKTPYLIIYNQNAKDTIEVKNGQDIGEGLLHYEGEAIYKRSYGGNGLLQVNFCYDFDYDTKANTILIKGRDSSTREFLNCIYRMDTYFEIYP